MHKSKVEYYEGNLISCTCLFQVKLVICGATSGPNAVTNVNRVFWRQLEILEFTMASRAEFRDVLKLVCHGKLQPIVDRVLPLEQAKVAHELLERGQQFGKIVLRV